MRAGSTTSWPLSRLRDGAEILANRLTKLISLTYVPAIPEQPARAAYCYAPRGQYQSALEAWISYLNGTIYDASQLLCFPAVPYSPGRDAEFNTSANLGWNAGAVSRAVAEGGCIARFKIVPSSAGVLAGLARAGDAAGSFNAITHGVIFSGENLRVVESGVEKVDSGIPLTGSTVIEIRRTGRVVTYMIGTWSYTSLVESAGDVRLAAVLYAAGDSVTEPSLQRIESMQVRSSWDWQDDFSRGRLQVQSGWGWGGMLEFNDARIKVDLKLLARMSENDYGEMLVDAGGVVIEASAGFAEVDFGIISSVMPVSFLVEGSEVVSGDINVEFGVIALGADYDYGFLEGDVGGVVVRGLDLGEAPDAGSYFEPLYLQDRFHADPVIYALISESLSAGSAIDVIIAVDAILADFLTVGDMVDANAILQALISSGVAISDNASQVRRELLQYATNLASGAVSRYEGFDFRGFTKVGMQAYGWKRDGLYKLGVQGDDGEMLNAVIELAAQDFGVANHKRLDSLLIGAATDGRMFVRITDDHGVSTTHPVQVRGSEARALLPKGRTSRFWRAQIIIEDATEARIDNVEWVVGTSSRRTTR